MPPDTGVDKSTCGHMLTQSLEANTKLLTSACLWRMVFRFYFNHIYIIFILIHHLLNNIYSMPNMSQSWNTVKKESKMKVAQSCPHGLYPTRLLCSRESSGKNTGVGSHSLLQGIFRTQGWNPGLPHHCRRILQQLRCQGSPVLMIRGLIREAGFLHGLVSVRPKTGKI